jgi:hypothetical protein
LPFKLLRGWPTLRRIPARLIGIGLRPEHVKTPNVYEDHGAQRPRIAA